MYTSWGCSTTQIASSLRRGSAQMTQRASSATLPHTSHSPTRCFTSRRVRASSSTAGRSLRSTKSARRWADFSPTPGIILKRATSLVSSGEPKIKASVLLGSAGRSRPWETEGAGDRPRQVAHLLLHQLLDLLLRVPERGEDEILQHLHVARQLRVDLDAQRLAGAGEGDGHHAASGAADHLALAKLFAQRLHLGLHLLGLLEHVAHVLEQAASSGTRLPAATGSAVAVLQALGVEGLEDLLQERQALAGADGVAPALHDVFVADPPERHWRRGSTFRSGQAGHELQGPAEVTGEQLLQLRPRVPLLQHLQGKALGLAEFHVQARPFESGRHTFGETLGEQRLRARHQLGELGPALLHLAELYRSDDGGTACRRRPRLALGEARRSRPSFVGSEARRSRSSFGGSETGRRRS